MITNRDDKIIVAAAFDAADPNQKSPSIEFETPVEEELYKAVLCAIKCYVKERREILHFGARV